MLWRVFIVFGACAVALLALVWVIPKIVRYIIGQQVKQAMTRLFTDPYTKNLLEGATALSKFGLLNTVENELRSEQAEVLLKPIGTNRPFPHFDGLLFSSAQLHRKALNHSIPVTVTTVLGRRAKRPMILSIPIMTSAMGYGVALNKPFVRALAKGTAAAGTALNTGQGPVLPEFRDLAHRLVVQYHGAPWRPEEDTLRVADMIEIRFGQGANAGCGAMVYNKDITAEIARDMGGADMGGTDHPSQDFYIPAGFPGIYKPHELRELVEQLRALGRGAPIALKLAAGNDLEADIKFAIQADIDVLVLDGAQGGTHSSSAILVDDFGIPTLAALCRAQRFLKHHGLRDRLDLVISGGIRTPGDVLKALALGADAVYMGTGALFAATHTQISKAIPFEPPTKLAWAAGQMKDQFDEDEGSRTLANFLISCTEELKMGARALGKTSVHDVDAQDLVAWDPEASRITGIPLV